MNQSKELLMPGKLDQKCYAKTNRNKAERIAYTIEPITPEMADKRRLLSQKGKSEGMSHGE